MLSDEEKKAIKELFEEDLKENYEVTAILDQIDLESLVIALNLIEKQSKEELKNADLTTVYLNGVYDGEKKVKDKIKAKIEEVEAMYDKLPKNPKEHLHSKTEYKIVIGELQSLLEKE